MKVIAALVATLAVHRVFGSGRSLDRGKLEAQGPAPAYVLAAGPPAAGPAPGPADAKDAAMPGLEAVHITFEIKNFNYFDLTKETCPKKVKVPKKKTAPPAPKADKGTKGLLDPLSGLDKQLGTIKAEDADPNVTAAVDDVSAHTDAMAKQVEGGLEDVADVFSGKSSTPSGDIKMDKPPGLPWMDKKKVASMIQLGACAPMPDLTETTTPNQCSTVMDVLRKAIKETVLGIIKCLYQQSLLSPMMAPGPAPMPAGLPMGLLPAAPAGVSGLVPLPPQQFLAPGPAPGPAPSPAGVVPAMPDVKVFVTFSPGREMEGGRSTLVEIAFLDTPNNGVDDIMLGMPLIEQSIATGIFHKQVKEALHAVTGVKPKLHKIELKTKMIEAFHVNKCEEHIKGIVHQFSLHYTRNQVPMALYNECTNFLTRMSFSHDYVLDPLDTVRCRKATAKFANHWDFGQNAEDSDFADMCLQACEAKYGRGAPTCNLHAGDGLLGQPL